MVILIELIAIYFIASLPGFYQLETRVNKSKRRIQFSLNEHVKVSQYLEFTEFWPVLFSEILKFMTFIWVINTGNYVLFLSFYLAILFPFASAFLPKENIIYFIVFEFYVLFWLGLFVVFAYLLAYFKARRVTPFISILLSAATALFLWLLDAELFIVMQALSIAVLEIARQVFLYFQLAKEKRLKS